VREQLEHDRVIRLLQARWRRKYTVGINVGAEQMAAVTAGDSTLYPDLVLTAAGARRPEIIVEVETGESVNNLEALAEWARLGQIRAEFHLYVPAGSVGPARRLCEEHKIPVAEICTYHHIGDEIRFSSAYKAPAPVRPAPRREAPATPARTAAPRRPAAASSATRKTASSRRTVKAAAAKRTRSKTVAKPARSQKRK
jgi:hypothetical protein